MSTNIYQNGIWLKFSNTKNIPGLSITSKKKAILDAKQGDIIAQAYDMTAENLNRRQFSAW